eukprot:tig00000241_g20943.t1
MANAAALRPVFISYSSKDKEFAWKLVEDLRLNGLEQSIWIDRDFIEAGQTGWREQIVKELNYCRVAICVLSANYYESVPCAKEANGLSDREERREDLVIIPLRYTMDPIPEKLQWVFDSSKQWVDFSEKGARAGRCGRLPGGLPRPPRPLCKSLGLAAPAPSASPATPTPRASAPRPGPRRRPRGRAAAAAAAVRSREYLEQADGKEAEQLKAIFRGLDFNQDALITLDDLNLPFAGNRVKIGAFMTAFGLRLNGRLEARTFVEKLVGIEVMEGQNVPSQLKPVAEAFQWLVETTRADAADPRQRAELLFRYYDRNASGGLSFDEVLAVIQAFRKSGDQEFSPAEIDEIRTLFDAVDENLDEDISLEEFVKAIETLPEFKTAWEPWETPGGLGPPVNAAGAPMARGAKGGIYYCGRNIGKCRCRPSGTCDGVCGTGSGCQCADCEAAEAEREAKGDAPRFKSARHAHELALQVPRYTGQTWGCDICKQRMKNCWRGKSFHCPQCKFDMCWACYTAESGTG